jgi:hypothetical protein
LNELKQKAAEFYAKEIWNNHNYKRVYINYRQDLFTVDTGDIFIGNYNGKTTGGHFFMDVIGRLRDYTRDYKIPTSLQNVIMEKDHE